MKVSAIRTEAAANLRHRPPVALVGLVLLIAAVTGGTATWAHRAIQLDVAERAAGRDVLVATATSDAGLSMTACEALAGNGPVIVAGGPYATAGPPLVTLDHSSVAATLVSPSALRVWLGPDAAPLTTLGHDLAEVLDARHADVILISGDVPIRARAVLPPDVPLSALQSTVIIPALDQAPLAECWIKFEPGAKEATEALVSAAFAGVPVGIGPFVPEGGGSLSARQFWSAYTSLEVWAVAGVVAGALLGTTLIFRRRDVSVYLMSGFSRRSVGAILAHEAILPTVILAPLAAMWGLAIAVFVARGPLELVALQVALAYAAATWLLFAIMATALSALATRVNPFAVLKDT